MVTCTPKNPDGTSVNLTPTHVFRVETSTVQSENVPKLNNKLAKFWDLETLGIKEGEPSVYDKFTQEVDLNGERYEAKLPFKEEHPLLPDNYSVCVKRLGSLIGRLQKTPVDWWKKSKKLSKTPRTGSLFEVEKSVIVKRNKYLITVLEHFWKRWSSEYFTQLREHHRSNKRDGLVINVGDVVTVKEDNVKRLNWQVALVDEVIKGKDGKSRAAVIRIMDKASKITRLKRPVQKPFPIELKTEMPKD